MKKELLLIPLFSFLLLFKTGMAQPGYINTVAGNGINGFSGDGGNALNAELSGPQGVVVDASGNIYFTDTFNNRIRKVNTTGIISTICGISTAGFSGDGGPATAAELNLPLGPALDGAGNLYISDQNNVRIRMINIITGIITTIAGCGIVGFGGDGGPATAADLSAHPGSEAIDAAGNIYIADYSNNRVRMVNTSGIISTFAGNGSPGNSGDGGPATAAELGNSSDGAVGVCADSHGNVYFTDNANNNVRMVNTSNIIYLVAGNGVGGYIGDGGTATTAELYDPVSVSTDLLGNIYISDLLNNCIREVNTSGIITTIAGNGTAAYFGDGGPATAAELDYPFGVMVDSHFNLYISDQQNERIRKIDSDMVLTAEKQVTQTEAIHIYPNPASSKVFVSLTQVSQNTVFSLYTISGQKVWSLDNSGNPNLIEINTESLPLGLYILKVEGDTGIVLVKELEIIQ